MRRTSKLYHLTLASTALTIFASILVALWNDNTSKGHLWLDIVPQGFGMASLITTTLIVSILHHRSSYAELGRVLTMISQAMIADVYKEDMAVATGSKCDDRLTL